MNPDEKKRSVASAEKTPRWSRRAFGRFAAIAAAAAAIWKPRVTGRKPVVSGVEADHWEPVAAESKGSK